MANDKSRIKRYISKLESVLNASKEKPPVVMLDEQLKVMLDQNRSDVTTYVNSIREQLQLADHLPEFKQKLDMQRRAIQHEINLEKQRISQGQVAGSDIQKKLKSLDAKLSINRSNAEKITELSNPKKLAELKKELTKAKNGKLEKRFLLIKLISYFNVDKLKELDTEENAMQHLKVQLKASKKYLGVNFTKSELAIVTKKLGDHIQEKMIILNKSKVENPTGRPVLNQYQLTESHSSANHNNQVRAPLIELEELPPKNTLR